MYINKNIIIHLKMKSFLTKYGTLDIFNNDTYNLEFLKKDLVPDQTIIEKHLLDYIIKSSVIINVGSGIGAHDLLFSKLNPSISVYSFEPREEFFYLLSRNLSKNNIENVVIMNNTLGHITGPVEFSTNQYNSVYDYEDLIEVNLGTLISNNKTYHLVTLDSLHLLQCNILFIDLDGFAYMVLIGGIKTIKKYKPIVCYRNSSSQLSFIHQDKNSCKEILEKLEYSIIEDSDFIIAKPIVSDLFDNRLDSKLFESTEIQDFVNISDDLVANV